MRHLYLSALSASARQASRPHYFDFDGLGAAGRLLVWSAPSSWLRQSRLLALSVLCLSLALVVASCLPGRAQSETDGKVTVRQLSGKGERLQEEFVVGKVKQVSRPTVNNPLLNATGMVSRRQVVELEVLEGGLKGKTVSVVNELTDNPSFNIMVQPGSEVVLSVVKEQNQAPEVNIADYHRAPVLSVLALLFLLSYIFVGGKSGLKSLLGLASAIALIALVLLPLSLRGYDPLLTSIGICALAATSTIVCVGGLSRKSLAAMLGTIGGVVIAGLAAHCVIDTAPLTGLASEEAQILRGAVLGQPPSFFAGLLAASMLIGALGVIMDVAISVASAVRELSFADPTLSARELYARGMNVGRDIMGSMTSTLVLAYAGGALPLLLLMAREPSIKFLNLDLVATEVASALTGSLGLIWTIPLTAIAAARLMSGGGRGKGVDRSDVFAGFPQTSQREDSQTDSLKAQADRRAVPASLCSDRSAAR